MKQKIFTLLFALLASVGTILAESGTCGEKLTWDLTNGVLTISGTGDMARWTRTIRIPWYSYRSSIQTVIIEEGVTSIGQLAFSGCNNLTYAKIPNSVTSIGMGAFTICTSLASINIPNSVTSIGNSAFSGCTGLASVTIGNSVTSIGTYAFGVCTGLTTIEIPNSVTSIGNSAFGGCTGLTTIEIPNSVTSIGNSAFGGCTGITSPVYNEHVFAYMPTSFSGTYSIPEGIESIAGYAFAGCTGLTAVEIPNSVISIEATAFYGCTSLTSVVIPNSVTSIGGEAFYECTSLTSVICLAIAPPVINLNTFDLRNKNIYIYVPAESLEAYKKADFWEFVTNILPFEVQAKSSSVTEFTVTSEENSIVLAWPAVENAKNYTIEVQDNNGNVVCVLAFNAQGELESIHFAAPARNGNKQVQAATQTSEGWQYVVNGLDLTKQYTFTLTITDNEDEELYSETISKMPTAIANTFTDSKNSTKILRNGQILILRGDKTYTLQGQEVR